MDGLFAEDCVAAATQLAFGEHRWARFSRPLFCGVMEAASA
jgi:hypothetical protein